MTQDISGYRIITTSRVRGGLLTRNDGTRLPVLLIVNDDEEVAFAFDMAEVEELTKRLFLHRHAISGLDRPMTRDEFQVIMWRGEPDG